MDFHRMLLQTISSYTYHLACIVNSIADRRQSFYYLILDYHKSSEANCWSCWVMHCVVPSQCWHVHSRLMHTYVLYGKWYVYILLHCIILTHSDSPNTLYHVQHVYGFVLIVCCWYLFLVNPHGLYNHVIQSCITAIGGFVWSPCCQLMVLKEWTLYFAEQFAIWNFGDLLTQNIPVKHCWIVDVTLFMVNLVKYFMTFLVLQGSYIHDVQI